MFWIIGADALMESLRKISDKGWVVKLANQFDHVDWEGFVFYDLIFPLFVFIIGVSLVFSLDGTIAQRGKVAAHVRILRRSILLFLLGVFYDEGVAMIHEENVLCGVLQRLALCYFFTSLLYCHFKLRGLIVAFFVLIIGYWALLSFVPVPGTGQVSFERDKNWAHYIDSKTPPYHDSDPEGYLSTFPAVGSCLLGVFAALLVKNNALSNSKKFLYLLAAGIILVVAGYAWGLQFPIIKRLWTSSYVLVAGGYSCILLSVFYLIVDIWKFRIWARPFIWIGMNSLTIYLVTNIVDFHDLAERFVGGDVAVACGRYSELVTTVVSLALCLLVVRFLYRKQIFLRV